MFYVLRPQPPSTLDFNRPLYVDLDPEDAYVERKRREYLAAVQQQQDRHAYERAVAAEEERHRDRLAALAQQERMRRHATHRRDVPPYAVGCAGPSCAPTNIVRGRYNCPREAPQFHTSEPAPVPQRSSRPQSEEITLERILAGLFGLSANDVCILHSSDLSAPILTNIQEPEVAARRKTQPTPVPQQMSHDINSTPAPVASTSTAPGPAPTAPTEPTEGHWSNAIKRTRSVAAISQISRTFESLKRTFTFPTGPLAPFEGSEAPRLAYNPTNAPIHAYEHALSELLTKLDTVESFGFRGIRELRKEVVVRIEKELEALERKVAEAIASGASPVIKATEVLVPEEAVSENQTRVEDKVGDKVAEDIIMVEEAEVAAVVASGDAGETAEGYELDTDDVATVVPAPTPVFVEQTLVTDSPMVGSEVQTVTIGTAQPTADTITFVVTPAQGTPVEPEPSFTPPKEDAVEVEYQGVGSDSIITELAIEPLTTTPEVAPNEVEATATTDLPFQTVLGDATATASSSESESDIEDAVDVTVSSDSEVEVTLEADDATFDAEKDFEML